MIINIKIIIIKYRGQKVFRIRNYRANNNTHKQSTANSIFSMRQKSSNISTLKLALASLTLMTHSFSINALDYDFETMSFSEILHPSNQPNYFWNSEEERGDDDT